MNHPARLGHMTTSGDRLRALLLECRLTPSNFAAHRGVTPQHVNNWFNRGVPLARLDEIAALFCVQRRWLLSGEGPKHANPLPRQCASHDDVTRPSIREGHLLRIPFHVLQDGRLQPDGNQYLPFSEQALQALGVNLEHAACVSMPPSAAPSTIPRDTILVIDRSLTWVIEDETYMLLHNGRLRVDRLTQDRQSNLYLHGQGPAERYTPKQRQAQGMQILGWVFHWSSVSLHRPG